MYSQILSSAKANCTSSHVTRSFLTKFETFCQRGQQNATFQPSVKLESKWKKKKRFKLNEAPSFIHIEPFKHQFIWGNSKRFIWGNTTKPIPYSVFHPTKFQQINRQHSQNYFSNIYNCNTQTCASQMCFVICMH